MSGRSISSVYISLKRSRINRISASVFRHAHYHIFFLTIRRGFLCRQNYGRSARLFWRESLNSSLDLQNPAIRFATVGLKMGLRFFSYTFSIQSAWYFSLLQKVRSEQKKMFRKNRFSTSRHLPARTAPVPCSPPGGTWGASSPLGRRSARSAPGANTPPRGYTTVDKSHFISRNITNRQKKVDTKVEPKAVHRERQTQTERERACV